ncbi:hypothetical protein BJV74DRAFT_797659 [Russula compacta]|nr:hypothetical protein BJV74DRAFT_797659 [Russula compacta]
MIKKITEKVICVVGARGGGGTKGRRSDNDDDDDDDDGAGGYIWNLKRWGNRNYSTRGRPFVNLVMDEKCVGGGHTAWLLLGDGGGGGGACARGDGKLVYIASPRRFTNQNSLTRSKKKNASTYIRKPQHHARTGKTPKRTSQEAKKTLRRKIRETSLDCNALEPIVPSEMQAGATRLVAVHPPGSFTDSVFCQLFLYLVVRGVIDTLTIQADGLASVTLSVQVVVKVEEFTVKGWETLLASPLMHITTESELKLTEIDTVSIAAQGMSEMITRASNRMSP